MGPKMTQAEGFILGVGAKMFTIAGPVIVYGVSASVVYDNDIILIVLQGLVPAKKACQTASLFVPQEYQIFPAASIRSKLWIQSAFKR